MMDVDGRVKISSSTPLLKIYLVNCQARDPHSISILSSLDPIYISGSESGPPMVRSH